MKEPSCQVRADQYYDQFKNCKLSGLSINVDDQMGKILFVDDDRDILEFYKKIASEMNISCLTAMTFKQALEIMKQDSIRVITLDIEINGENGIEIAKKIRESHHDINIIFISGKIEQYRDEINMLGCKSLPKPFNIEKFMSFLSN